MKISRLLALILFGQLILNFSDLAAQPLSLEWVVGNTGPGSASAYSVTIDQSGNDIVVGTFRGTVDFDPGMDTIAGVSPGISNGYLEKISPAGNVVWVKIIESASNVYFTSVDIDTAGNIWAIGGFDGTADFDPGPGVFSLSAQGSYDGFILKLDSAGNFIWAGAVGGTMAQSFEEIKTDKWGNVYVAGEFEGNTDVDPSPSTTLIFNASGFYYDGLLLKLDLSGNLIYAREFDCSGYAKVKSVATDSLGNIFLVGRFNGNLDADPGNPVNNFYGFDASLFMVKLDPAGYWMWGDKIIGSSGFGNAVTPESMKIDKAGNLIVGGLISGSADFDLSSAVQTRTSSGGGDIFLFKWTASGGFLWANVIGGSNGDEWLYELAVDKYGDIFSTGYFQRTVDFDPGSGVSLITAQGFQDIFVLKLKSNGQFGWARSISSAQQSDYGHSIFIDSTQHLHLAGTIADSADFDPGSGLHFTSFEALNVAYVAKWGTCFPSDSTLTTIGCNSYTLNGVTYANSGTYTQVLRNDGGCDSTITLILDIQQPSAYTFADTACHSYTLNGTNYAFSGTYTQTIPNQWGCDSLITLNLVLQKNDTTFSAVACDQYAIGGSVFTTSGTHYVTLTNSKGCDSVITLNLTIENLNVTANQNMQRLTALPFFPLDTYQWFDCTNGLVPIPGATSQVYSPQATSSYAVSITHNGCTDTSACRYFSYVGIDEILLNREVRTYPNPTSGLFQLDLSNLPAFEEYDFKIFNALGQNQFESTVSGGQIVSIDLKGLASGIYFLHINGFQVSKRIKIQYDRL